jgi:hypothetical protein
MGGKVYSDDIVTVEFGVIESANMIFPGGKDGVLFSNGKFKMKSFAEG